MLGVETFLPFDMEFTYGAALHIAMAGVLFPSVTDSQETSLQDAYSILDQMIDKGNKLASARKSELVQLETLFRDLAGRIERRGMEMLVLPVPAVPLAPLPGALPSEAALAQGHAAGHAHTDPQDAALSPAPVDSAHNPETLPLSMTADPGSDSPSEIVHDSANVDFLDSIGISSYEFFSLVNQIGNPESYVLDPGLQPWDSEEGTGLEGRTFS
jgi:hypothetical protein